MTVINKLNQTLESIKAAETNCRTFSMDTDDQNAKQMFTQLAQNLKHCQDMLQNRINFVCSEEPQYKSQEQQMQQQIQQDMKSNIDTADGVTPEL